MWHRNAPTYLNILAIAIIILITAPNNTAANIIITPINSYFSSVWSGSEDPLWPNVILLGLSVVAAIAVGFAIFVEHPRISHRVSARTQAFAFWCLVFGVPTEPLCTILLFVVDERISIAQTGEIVVLTRAAGPRNLVSDDISRISTVLKTLGSQPYDLTLAPMLESGSYLDNQIVGSLRGAGWVLVSNKWAAERAQIPFILFTFSISSEAFASLKISEADLHDSSRLTDTKIGVTHDISGVMVLFRNNKFTTPAFTLAQILKDAGIGSVVAGWAQDTGMNDDAIHIIIGRK